ncbi:hypothetical protein M3M33_17550, partial [Loigolactobacillus coryniformis]|uniref:hypothetical protein n=1 Tax=Loigolactobacillus coryniformis TaxID=1610 RepID=UPI00201AB1CC
SLPALEKRFSNISVGEKQVITLKTAEFIRDSELRTGLRFRNMQMWTTESEFLLNGEYYTLIWPDRNQGIMIQKGST